MGEATVESFEFNGKGFDINTSQGENQFSVTVTLDGVQVSPVYSVDLGTHADYFLLHKEKLVDHLKSIARTDIQDEMYFKG